MRSIRQEERNIYMVFIIGSTYRLIYFYIVQVRIIIYIQQMACSSRYNRMNITTSQLEILYELTQNIQNSFKDINEMLRTFLTTIHSNDNHHPPYRPLSHPTPTEKNKNISSNPIKKMSNNNGNANVAGADKIKNPLTPFFLFLKDKREAVRKEYPDLSSTELSNVMGQVWKSLSSEQKRPYEQQYNRSRAQFQKKRRMANDDIHS